MMSLSIGKMLTFMKKYGHHYPVIYVLNRGNPVEMDESEDENALSILNIDHELKEDTDKPDHIYRTLISMKLQNEKDEENVQRVANLIAQKYEPDVIGLIMPCMYAEYTEENPKIPESLDDEPEACTILHACYWRRGEDRGMLTQAPFQTDGTHAGKEDLPWIAEEGDAVNYGVVATPYPWQFENDKLQSKLRNPWGNK